MFSSASASTHMSDCVCRPTVTDDNGLDPGHLLSSSVPDTPHNHHITTPAASVNNIISNHTNGQLTVCIIISTVVHKHKTHDENLQEPGESACRAFHLPLSSTMSQTTHTHTYSVITLIQNHQLNCTAVSNKNQFNINQNQYNTRLSRDSGSKSEALINGLLVAANIRSEADAGIARKRREIKRMRCRRSPPPTVWSVTPV